MSRRDFTVNAIALSLDGTLYDYFGGQQDLQQKILRTVGDANTRFREDALRMLRACRFAAQLGFTYEQAGCEALPACGAPNTPYYLPHGYSFPVEAAPDFHWSVCARSLKSSLPLSMQAKA